MERFFGFDLGDAESAVSYLKKEGMKNPEIIPVRDAGSFITAYARLSDQTLLIMANYQNAPAILPLPGEVKKLVLTNTADPSFSENTIHLDGYQVVVLEMA